MRLLNFVFTVCCLLEFSFALIPIDIKHNRFIRPSSNSSEDGKVFQIIGVDYQPGGASAYDPNSGEDVLSDNNYENCKRDAYLFQQLGINTIRVYSINPWVSHDSCVSLFNAAGIYIVIDTNTPQNSIYRHHPADSYNKDYLNHIFGVVDAFKNYPNLLGFFAGNEVVNDGESARLSPPYVRAVIRDLKSYIALHANRTIPVGYSAADDKDLRDVMLMYLECEKSNNDTSTADFYGLNSYEWCSGRDDWQSSGYENLYNTFKDTSIPIFLSEYGCNVDSPRTFSEVYDGVYGKLAEVFSGGLIYEFSEEPNNYGLVDIKEDGSIKILQDFVNLQEAYNKINISVQYESSVSSTIRPICNSTYKETLEGMYSDFNASFTLPPCPASDILSNGVGNNNIGQIISVNDVSSSYKIYNSDGEAILDTEVSLSSDNQINSPSGGSISDAKVNSSDTEPVSSTSVISSSAEPSSDTEKAITSSTSKAEGSPLHFFPESAFLWLVFGTIGMVI